jgi:single-stranded-DNA-specific exonuclease
LRKLRDPSRPGLQALRAVSGVAPGRIRSWDVSFLLAPRLNASGRLESAEAALNLLMARDAAEARNLADRLDAANRERQGIQKETVQQAVDWIQLYTDPELDTALVVADERWHAGVVGIVAARLVGRFHRPAFVIALDGAGGGRGSGRSIEGIPLVECLNECADHLRKYGGHAMAAGIEIDAGRVPAFRDAFRAAVGRRLTPELRNPRLRIDAEVALEEIDLDLADALGRLEPFGQGHPEPVWIARRVNIEEPRILKDAHLKMRLRQGTAVCPAIGFGLAKLPIPDGDADVVFTIERDEWQNRPRVQIKVIDLAPSESRAQA